MEPKISSPLSQKLAIFPVLRQIHQVEAMGACSLKSSRVRGGLCCAVLHGYIYRVFQKELYKFESVKKFIQRTYTTF